MPQEFRKDCAGKNEVLVITGRQEFVLIGRANSEWIFLL